MRGANRGRWLAGCLVVIWAAAACSDDVEPQLDRGVDSGPDSAAPDAEPADLAPDAPLPPLTLGKVSVEDNPRSVLSCFVSFSTSVAALPFVEFTRAGAPSVRVRVDGPVPGTKHRVLVFGMHASKAHSLVAGARSLLDGSEKRAAAVKYTTAALPAFLPRAEVLVHDRRRAQHGWPLMTVRAGDRENNTVTMDPYFTPTAVMYDMDGEPVWYRVHGLPRLGDTRYSDGRVLVQSMGSINEPKLSAMEVDLSGAVVWRGPMQPERNVHGHFNHHFERLPDGNYIALKNAFYRRVLGDVIVVMKPNHKEIWTWSTFDHIKPDLGKWDGKGNFDYTHGNSVVMDADRGVVYYNARHQDMVYKIRMSTGKVIWRLGEGGTFKADPKVKYPWFLKAHGVEVQPNGNVLVYDNGMKSRGWSRAVEYELDLAKKTSRVAWQYSGFPNKSWMTLYWGDADRLPNGNTLITAGTWVKGQRSHIFEVTPDWRRVWEIRLPKVKQTGRSVGVYNSQRMTPPLTITRTSGGK